MTPQELRDSINKADENKLTTSVLAELIKYVPSEDEVRYMNQVLFFSFFFFAIEC
jgi:hypothetical protein